MLCAFLDEFFERSGNAELAHYRGSRSLDKGLCRCLGFLPRRQQFLDAPNVIGQARFHRRRHTQAKMDSAEIIPAYVRSNGSFQIFQTLAESQGETSKAPQMCPDAEIGSFDVAMRDSAHDLRVIFLCPLSGWILALRAFRVTDCVCDGGRTQSRVEPLQPDKGFPCGSGRRSALDFSSYLVQVDSLYAYTSVADSRCYGRHER